MAAADVMSAVKCLMEETVEEEIEEIKALMEEMELDSIEVELEVEVELDSDVENNGEQSGCEVESDSDREENSGDAEPAEAHSGDDSPVHCSDDSVASSSEESMSSGDSDCGSPASHQFPAPKRKKAVTFRDDVEIVYIEACNTGRKVAELQSPKKKPGSTPASPSNVKKYKLRGKDGPVFVELTEEAAAYLKFIQILREHGHTIMVKDFYKEASDFAKGIMPDFVRDGAPCGTPLKSSSANAAKDRRPTPFASGKDSSRPSSVSTANSAGSCESWKVSAHPDDVRDAVTSANGNTSTGKRQRNKDKVARAGKPKQQKQQQGAHAGGSGPAHSSLLNQQCEGDKNSVSEFADPHGGYSVYVHNGAHYFGPAPSAEPASVSSDTEADAYALMYGEGDDCSSIEGYFSADEFAHAMVYADENDENGGVQFASMAGYSDHLVVGNSYPYQQHKFPYYDMQSSKSARAFFAGSPAFHASAHNSSPAVPVSAGAGHHGNHGYNGHHGNSSHGKEAPYQNNYPQAHRPMRGRGRGQHSRQYHHSSQPYRKQQGRSPRK